MVPVVATAGGTSSRSGTPCCADREKGSEAVSPVAIVWPCPLAVSMRTRRPAAGLSMTDLWVVALLAGSGAAYATTYIVLNLLSFILAIALGAVLWVLADR